MQPSEARNFLCRNILNYRFNFFIKFWLFKLTVYFITASLRWFASHSKSPLQCVHQFAFNLLEYYITLPTILSLCLFLLPGKKFHPFWHSLLIHHFSQFLVTTHLPSADVSILNIPYKQNYKMSLCIGFLSLNTIFS